MLILTVMALVIASIPLAGGQLRRLGQIRLYGSYLLGMALVAQIAVISLFPGASERVNAVVHVATYGLAAAFVYRNRSVPGLLVIAAGGALNGFCIALNGGTLPARAAALEKAGIAATPGEFVNSGVLADPKLWWLGDVFYVPGWLPVSNVFSIGDVVILAGAAYGLHSLAQSRLTHIQIKSRYDLPPLDDDLDLLLAEDWDDEDAAGTGDAGSATATSTAATSTAATPRTATPTTATLRTATPTAATLRTATPTTATDRAGTSPVADDGPAPSLAPFLAAAATVSDDAVPTAADATVPDVPQPRQPHVTVATVAGSATATSTVAWHDPALVAAVAADADLTTD